MITFLEQFLPEGIVIVHRCIQESAGNFKFLPLPCFEFVGKGGAAPAQELSRQTIAALQDLPPGEEAVFDRDQKGVLFKTGKVPHVQGAELGEGFGQKPGGGMGEQATAVDTAFVRACHCLNELQPRPARMDDDVSTCHRCLPYAPSGALTMRALF